MATSHIKGMRVRQEENFYSVFDERTGFYMRSGVIEDGRDTGIDPFGSSFPELLDVGIMGHCVHGTTGLCVKAGIECYQDGLHASAPNMSVVDFESIASQCAGKTYQFALGGCGDPDQHESFAQLLEICEAAGIVSNFTTSGFGLTKDKAALCKRHCGAVAVSWYRSRYTNEAIAMLLAEGVKTNIHYVLSRRTIDEAVERLEGHTFPQGINAVIFLLHKPVGIGTQEQVLSRDAPALQRFLKLALTQQYPFKIGFDSCSVPAILQEPGITDPQSIDTCEGARWSAYITADMQMLPCSFDNQERRWAVSLRDHTIAQAWNSAVFEDFRNRFRTACPRCALRNACFGGCPICPEIVLCERPERAVSMKAAS